MKNGWRERAMKLHSIWIAIAAIIVAGVAQAGDWVVAGYNGQSFVGYDRSSVNRVGRRATTWWFLALYDPLTGDHPEQDFYVLRSTFDCDDFRQTDLYLAVFNGAGEQVSNETVSNPHPEFFAPDTLTALVSARACEAGAMASETGANTAQIGVLVERAVKQYRDDPEGFLARTDAADAAAFSDTADGGSASDSVATVPPCSNGAAECDPWDRKWPKDGSGVAVGTVVTRDGRVIPDPPKPHERDRP